MANFNLQRLSEDIKREISAAVSDIKDPRVAKALVTVTHCEVTSDLSYCRVKIACMGGTERTESAVEGMKAASGFIKKRIASAIRIRKMPELVFLPDNSLEYSAHIEEIISGFHKGDNADNMDNGGKEESDED